MPVSVRTRVRSGRLADDLAADRTWSAENSSIPWLEESVSLEGRHILEYGCGAGLVSRAFAQRAEHVHGLDIDAQAIEQGRRWMSEHDVGNVELEAHPPEEIIDVMRGLAGKVDVVLLYAVLEHLTVDERLEVLTAAREITPRDGHIICVETPNRLCSFDFHSSQLPYVGWLPAELAIRYSDRSRRPDFAAGLKASRAAGTARDWWTRFGTTVSFHEFELVFGDIDRHVIAGGYETVMWPARPLLPWEVSLSRDIARQRPDLGPVWSRGWLDVVLSPKPIPSPPPVMRPWVVDLHHSHGAVYTESDAVALGGPDACLRVELAQPTRRLIVGFIVPPGEVVLEVHPSAGDAASVPTHSGDASTRYVELAWDQSSESFEITLGVPGYVSLVAYEDDPGAFEEPVIGDTSPEMAGLTPAHEPLYAAPDVGSLQNRPQTPMPTAPIELLRESPWQMSFGERAALDGLLAQRRPSLAIEIGTAEGGSLMRIAAHSAEVHSFDLVEPDPEVRRLPNVTFHIGDSHVLLPEALAALSAEGRVVDFVLVDGDHSSEGVRRDLEDLLDSPCTSDTLIVMHDTMNEVVREGLEAVEFEAWPKVAYVELDFVSGYMFREPSLFGELWGGLGLVVTNTAPKPVGRARQERYFESYRLYLSGRDRVLEASQAAHRLAKLQQQPVDEYVDLRAECDRLQAELSATRAELQRLQKAWGSVMDSVSWRVTAPLRDVKTRFRRLIS